MRVNIENASAMRDPSMKPWLLDELVRNLKEMRDRSNAGDMQAAVTEFFEVFRFNDGVGVAALAAQPGAVSDWRNAALAEVAGCFEAAMAEGLLDALANTTDDRLKDLVERRLMYAYPIAAQAAPTDAKPAPCSKCGLGPPPEGFGCAWCNKPAQQDAVGAELEPYDAGLLNDFGGGNVEWWQDYIRAELGRAHDFYQTQCAAISAKKVGAA